MHRRTLAAVALLLGQFLGVTHAVTANQAAKPIIEPSNSMTNNHVFLPDDDQAVRFQAFFREFTNAVQEGQVSEVYAQDAYLNDSLKEIRGASAIEEYFVRTLDMASRVDVRFDDAAVSGESYYFRWTMEVVAAKLNGGEPIRSQGMSHVKFDEAGKVAMHKDYWDSSSGLLEHIPVLGGIIRWLKGRL